MKCPSCGFENNDGAKFCKNCGTKLNADTITKSVETASTVSNEVPTNRNNVANAPANEGTLSKGCKIWFWFVLVVNVLSAFANLSLMSYSPGLALFAVLSGGVLAGGSAMILFKQKKIGLYMIIAMAVLACIVNIANHVNVLFAVLSAVLNPAISYYFVNKNAAVIK